MLVEHDLSILDYLSDMVCCLYGEPGTYGIVTMPYSCREGINIFLSGYVPTENMRFRKEAIVFRKTEETPKREPNLGSENPPQEEEKNKEDEISKVIVYQYPKMAKQYKEFSLEVEAGEFKQGRITMILGENGTGKTTFIRILAGKDEEIKDGVNKRISILRCRFLR
jgi:ATP-binding cassette subfamily E protein 1